MNEEGIETLIAPPDISPALTLTYFTLFRLVFSASAGI
jgi:hypothetical protein